MNKNTILIYLILPLLDALTKLISHYYLKVPYTIIPDFMSFMHTENYNIAFSIALPYNIHTLIIPIILVCLTYYMYSKKMDIMLFYAFMMIQIGGICNYIDRLYNGYVTDFISIYTFPIFNMADIYVSIGVIMIVCYEIMSAKKSRL